MKRPKPLADLVEDCLGQTIARQGFARADILLSWPEIVGERLAGVSQPIKIEWPRGRPGGDQQQPASLVVRVEGAFALELQHLSPVILERVNGFYGWRCVGRLILKQGPLRSARPPKPAVPEALGSAERGRIAQAVCGIEDEGLRDALDRLGQAVARDREAGGQPVPSVPQSPL